MIETIAITIGTNARNEAKTKASTTSAPRPPISASSSTPGPSLSAPESSNRASNPVSCTGSPATVTPASALLRGLLGGRVLAERPSPGRAAGRRRAKVVRPSSETNASSPVEA